LDPGKIAGSRSLRSSLERRLLQAGEWDTPGRSSPAAKEPAAGKIEALKAAGIAVADTPAMMADTLISAMKERK
jgi:succinyl-CoA synthetase alpha subunit